MRNKIAVSIAALSAGLLLASSASAATNLVTNGGFETNGGTGQLGYNTSATGWTTNDPNTFHGGYSFLFQFPSADTTGSTGLGGNVVLYGPGNGVLNGLTASPDGGFFLGSDPGILGGEITQTLTGLTAGSKYEVSFYWAAAQQVGYDGPTTEGWQVGFGGSSQSTSPLDSNANHGFVPWQKTTFDFVADNSTDTLSFLAIGGPSSSLPPFALLDGVSVISVPEPTTWALMIMGFGGIGAMVRNRRRQAALA